MPLSRRGGAAATSICYALLVGVDAYREPLPRLLGCRRDVTRAEAFLRGRAAAVDVVTLVDEQATRAAVIGGFRSHLGRAGAGDTAVFWFSGHGSQAQVPAWWRHRETTGMLQTFVCADSRHADVPDLLDKELRQLISEVAAGGAHVLVVLDCCHAGGGTRDPGARVRRAAPASQPIRPEALLPELRNLGAQPPVGPPDHVALAACRSAEVATETLVNGLPQGVFSAALLSAARTMPDAASCREVFAAARTAIANQARPQRPVLFPVDTNLADRPLLGGTPLVDRTAMTMRYVGGKWEVDAGTVHGLPVPGADGELRLAVIGPGPAREVCVDQMFTERGVVRPLDWSPEPGRGYRLAVSALPLPPLAVGCDPALAPVFAEVAAAVRTAGPSGGPSPHIVLVDSDTGAGVDPWSTPGAAAGASRAGVGTARAGTAVTRAAEVLLRPASPDRLLVLDEVGTPLTTALPAAPPHGPSDIVAKLEHIARWRRVRALTNPVSGIAGAVAVDLVEAASGDTVPSPVRPGLRPDGGAIRLEYRGGPWGWEPPTVFLRLRNATRRRLYCVLLDLTDRFKISAELLDGRFVDPGDAFFAAEGDPVAFTLPAGRAEHPGAAVRDWLKLIVSEEEFNPLPFVLPALGEPVVEPVATRGLDGLLESLGRQTMTRDAGRVRRSRGYDWTTLTVAVRTEVPMPGPA